MITKFQSFHGAFNKHAPFINFIMFDKLWIAPTLKMFYFAVITTIIIIRPTKHRICKLENVRN